MGWLLWSFHSCPSPTVMEMPGSFCKWPIEIVDLPIHSMVIFHSYVNHANMNANAPGLIHSTKCLQDEMWVWQSLRPKHLDAIITQLTADHCHRLCISRMMTHTQNQCKTCKNLRRTQVQIQNMSRSKCKEHGMYLGSFI